MATFDFSAGRPQYDWLAMLQGILAGNNAVSSISGATSIALAAYVFDENDRLHVQMLTLRGSGLTTDADGALADGTISSIEISDGAEGSPPQTLLVADGLPDIAATDIQQMMDGAFGLDAYGPEFLALIAPLLFFEAIDATGSPDADSIIGSAFADLISGEGGDDYLRPGDNVDSVAGGDGFDLIDYSADARAVGIVADLEAQTVVDNDVPGAAVDTISGIEGIFGTIRADILRGSAGVDWLYGNGGDDSIDGRDGDDILRAGAGTDMVDGGIGTDTLSYADFSVAGITVTWSNGTAGTVLDPSSSTDTFTNVEIIEGSGGSDVFNGSAGSESMRGLGGADLFISGGGTDTMQGGDGDDEYQVASTAAVAIESNADMLTGGDDLVTFSGLSGTYTLGANLERLTLLGAANVNGTGNGLDNTITGNSGNNILDGGAGKDTLIGSDGNDEYLIERTDETVTEANTGLTGGDDTVKFSGLVGTYTLAGNVERLTLLGTAAISGNGNTLDNVIIGNSAGNTLNGRDGGDTMDGGLGTDTVNGEGGNDTITVSKGSDIVDGGTGADHLVLDYAAVTVDIAAFFQTASSGGGFGGTTQDAGLHEIVTAGHFESFTILTGSGQDRVRVRGTYNFVSTGGNSDVITIAHGSVDGGAGTDTLDVNSHILNAPIQTAGLSGTVTSGTDTGSWQGTYTDGAGVFVTFDDIENINLETNGYFDDNLTTGGGKDLFWMVDGGHDDVDGQAGMDTLRYRQADLGTGLTGGVTGAGNVDGWKGSFTGAASQGIAFDNIEHLDLALLAGNDTVNLGAGTSLVTDNGRGQDIIDGEAGIDSIAISNAALASSATTITSAGSVDGYKGTFIDANGNRVDFDNVEAITVQLTGATNDTVTMTMRDVVGAFIFTAANAGTKQVNLDYSYVTTALTSAFVNPGTAGETVSIRTGLTDRFANLTGVDVLDLTLGSGADVVTTGIAMDTVRGGLGNDTIATGKGNDTLIGEAGTDVLAGGDGNDIYVLATGDASTDTITETSAVGSGTADLVRFIGVNAQTYVLATNVERLVLDGVAAANGTGNTLTNIITGNGAANMLNGKAGVDTLAGMGGNDTYVIDRTIDGVTTDTVSEALNAGTDTVRFTASAAAKSYTLTANVESLIVLGTLAANGVGNLLANVFTGNTGINVFTGGDGNDVYYLQNATDGVSEANSAAAGGTDLVIFTGVAGETYTLGGSYIERLTLAGVAATNGNGNIRDNTIVGNAAANTIDGRAGRDVLAGMGGDDVYLVNRVVDGAITDTVSEGVNAGTDTVRFTAGAAGQAYTLTANVEILILLGTLATNGTGSAVANTITGNAAANVLDGRAGMDTLRGLGGDDTYVINLAVDGGVADTVTESANAGTDTVRFTGNTAGQGYTLGANVENLTILGGLATNGDGNTLANTIVGNAAANSLNGGVGLDTLTGGGGSDIFVFNAPLVATNRETITDMNTGNDTIHLENAIFVGLGAVSNVALAVGAFNTNNAEGKALERDDRITYDKDSGQLWYDSNGSDPGGTIFNFASVTPNSVLTAADFYVI